MVGNISSGIQVSQTYTRNVEMADTRQAQKTGTHLPPAPNQNIATGTRGAFKSSLAFFKESMQGLRDAPLGKKLDFLKDRTELRSMQKQEAARFERSERQDIKDAGAGFVAKSSGDPTATASIRTDSTLNKAQLSLSLTAWVGEARERAASEGTSVADQFRNIADGFKGSLSVRDFAEIDLKALLRFEGELRAQARHDKADLLGEICRGMSETLTQTQAEQRYLGTVREYIATFDKDMPEFWRNNHSGGELEIKAVIQQGFTQPLREKLMDVARHIIEGVKISEDDKTLSANFLTEEQAQQVGRLAEQLLDALYELDLPESMLATLDKVNSEIASIRTEDKGEMTRKFMLNALMLKGIMPELSEQLGTVGRLAGQMLYEAVMASRTNTDTPFGREIVAMMERIGDKGEALLTKFGMPDIGLMKNVVIEREFAGLAAVEDTGMIEIEEFMFDGEGNAAMRERVKSEPSPLDTGVKSLDQLLEELENRPLEDSRIESPTVEMDEPETTVELEERTILEELLDEKKVEAEKPNLEEPKAPTRTPEDIENSNRAMLQRFNLSN